MVDCYNLYFSKLTVKSTNLKINFLFSQPKLDVYPRFTRTSCMIHYLQDSREEDGAGRRDRNNNGFGNNDNNGRDDRNVSR